MNKSSYKNSWFDSVLILHVGYVGSVEKLDVIPFHVPEQLLNESVYGVVFY